MSAPSKVKPTKEQLADCARGEHNRMLHDGTPSRPNVSCMICGVAMARHRGDWVPVGKRPAALVEAREAAATASESEEES